MLPMAIGNLQFCLSSALSFYGSESNASAKILANNSVARCVSNNRSSLFSRHCFFQNQFFSLHVSSGGEKRFRCRSQPKAEFNDSIVVDEKFAPEALKILEHTAVNGKTYPSISRQSAVDTNESKPRVNGYPGLEDAGIFQGGIADFLVGKTLLVTGATGFLAKVLVEKILREQPRVGHIYLVIQARAGFSPNQRLRNQVLGSQAFELLREKYSDEYLEFMESKITAISGNISKNQLGMTDEAYRGLQESVDVVINSAATTTFDERYDVAVGINTLGPKLVVEFAKQCKRIQLLLHVSTAFTNGMRVGETPEKPFVMGDSITRELTGCGWLPGVQVEQELQLIQDTLTESRKETQSLSSDKAEAHIHKKMVDLGMRRAQHYGWQDTYVFTKAMGEMLVSELRGDLPVAIVRPSIVESSISEPLQGWMEGIRMADPILIAYGKGQMDGFLADVNACLDVVPVDCVINAMLAMLPKHANQPGLQVYQVATSVCNPLTNLEVSLAATEHFAKFPMLARDRQPIVNPPMEVYPSPLLFQLHMLLKYQLPLQVERVLAGFNGSSSSANLAKRRNNLMLKTFEQLSYLAELYRPYTFYKCRFDASNTMKLFAELSQEDRERFNFDLTKIQWREYFVQVHLPGLRKFVLKGRGTE